jgi:hypothetical protein
MNLLEKNRLLQPISFNIIVVDNFYENPIEVRDFAISQIANYQYNDYHPGKRSSSFATEHHKDLFNKILEPFSGKIIKFDTSKNKEINSNGSFQYNISSDKKSWIHRDSYETNWAGIIYLTPDAPVSSGTGFFKYKDGTLSQIDELLLNNSEELINSRYDNTKWEKVNSIGNIFNRLVLFRSNQYHMSLEYFGDNINNGRLIQLFFFTTEI